MHDAGNDLLSRRGILRLGAAATATGLIGAAVPSDAMAAVYKAKERVVAMHNINTGEMLEVVYAKASGYNPAAMQKLNSLMRDRRNDESTRMDPRLIDAMWALSQKLGSKKPFQLICGYRSPASNAMRAAMSDGVASNSYHTRGMAADIALPDVSLGRLRRAAMELKVGGVGYYPRDGFVHIDVGPVRTW
ncbi:DUF882 domain-containing protein [Insolitispirillum peregrinum]|uniref:Murein endopeptidase K n=1 Tax=Insolitispirillum peregrinum TaxID=80876 RepID=A0A1N7LMC0_9PROT|nr:DUF882 domain-containing protein [Insolitispirillum peregrinum]SIS74993.1 Uncharacterized conserved protein YcbK, DUF882 family [Insolitispirillum peregrinum]